MGCYEKLNLLVFKSFSELSYSVYDFSINLFNKTSKNTSATINLIYSRYNSYVKLSILSNVPMTSLKCCRNCVGYKDALGVLIIPTDIWDWSTGNTYSAKSKNK